MRLYGTGDLGPRQAAEEDRHPVSYAVPGLQGVAGCLAQVRERHTPGDCPGGPETRGTFEGSYQTLRASVEQELISRVKAASPAFFEELVVRLLVAMGYGGSQAMS